MAGVVSARQLLCSKNAASHVQQHLLRKFLYFQGASSRLLTTKRLWNGVHVRQCSSEGHGESSVKVIENRNLIDQADQFYRDRFIPLTRRTTVTYLLQEDDKLTHLEKKNFEKFALSLDAVISNKYAATLQELKQLFDPISPDKDTVSSREVSSRERSDNEFWLLQRLSQVMEKANFYELTDAEVKSKMADQEHHHEGVKVAIDLNKYSIIKFWVLGKEILPVKHSLRQQMLNWVLRKSSSKSESVYKRVIAAVRLNKEDKLTLKAFKDIAVGDLEKVLPVGSIRIGKFDRYFIMSSVGLTSAALLAKFVTFLAKMSVTWPLIFAGATSLIGVRGYWAYRSRKNKYLTSLNKTLYYKNIANNRGLITLVVDRAQDESFKEALLTYTFIHAMSRGGSSDAPFQPENSVGVTSIALENAVEKWVYERTGSPIEFDSAEAVSILEKVGILSVNSGGVTQTLSVLPLEQAHRLLPQTPLSILTRVDDSDVTEGYDRFRYEKPSPEPKRDLMRFFKVFRR